MIKALRRPPRLKEGDRVAVVSPATPGPEDQLDKGLGVLRSWGLEPVEMPHVRETHPRLPYLAGSDGDRARDFEAAWADRSFTAVVCARGGYGAQRMIDLVDWAALADAEPKAFVGFSDVTALHEAIALRLGVATLHGPMPNWSRFIEGAAMQEHLRRSLFSPESVQTIAPPSARTLAPGRARGVTVGGCLSLLASGIGTPEHRDDCEGGILLLEDTGEDDYRVDRYLTQLRRSGWLGGVAGIVLGSWVENNGERRLHATLADLVGDLGVPVVEDFGFGHCTPSLTVPLGVPAVLDADAGTLAFEIPALR
ncbi:S66 peptidase family protein [Glycomyces tenuis]|uniref:S66 peptidase family protein n=1 Tax=Glycomyces tenuis TaxID=58116 RepID=UPI000412B59E|nr:LD-carboxypeptidase [Glycomyces tenuis]